MKEKINIAKILKDKPRGTKLYSSACGKCELKEADDKIFKVSFYSSKSGFMIGGEGTFDKNGNLYDDGECIVFHQRKCETGLSSHGRGAMYLLVIVDLCASSKNGHLMTIQGSTDVILMACQMQKRLSIAS